ncbi:MAG: hypothetical protein HOL40_03705, partial [Cellvibrionales bacterium]|nr:hypothetical protein [Cellvibrionales bacterium]
VQLVFPNLSGQVMALLPAAWNNIIIVLVVFGLVQGAIITACALAAESALKLKKTNLTPPLTQQDVKITCANAHNSSSPSSKNRF